MANADLETAIGRGRIAPVYVLGGEDQFLLHRLVIAIRRAAVPDGPARALNYDVFEGKHGAAAILGAAQTLPMMAARRLVQVTEAETLPAAELEKLLPYLADPCQTTVLLLLFAKIDGRLKFFVSAKKHGFLHEITAPKQVSRWILDEARRQGVAIGDASARRLADVVGRDPGRLASALEQLSLYVGDGRAITSDDVDDLVAETRERSVFELTNAVFSGNREQALRAAGRLLEQQESTIGVTIMLARHVRQLALAKELVAARTSFQDMPRLLGVPPFAVEGLLSQARRIPAGAVARALSLLARADRDFKGSVKSALGERILLERLINGLVAVQSEKSASG
ncbi:MAG: DNA polymerase III subunit delta [Pseudomonadota bacterium]